MTTPIQYTKARKQIITRKKQIILTLDYSGPVSTPVDAMTLITDWLCRELRIMGYDPRRIVEMIDQHALNDEPIEPKNRGDHD